MKKTLDSFKKELDDVLLTIRSSFIKLGEKLWEAKTAVSSAEYDELTTYVEKQGIRHTDQRAAIAAFLFTRQDIGGSNDLRIDPRLIFAGAANSKILSMDKEDQERLLSDERFTVLQPSGRSTAKTWPEMSEQERNTLIGKGGKIRALDEQQCARDMRHPTRNASLVTLERIDINRKLTVLHAKDSPVQMQCDTSLLARMIDDEEWGILVELRKQVRQETGNRKIAVG